MPASTLPPASVFSTHPAAKGNDHFRAATSASTLMLQLPVVDRIAGSVARLEMLPWSALEEFRAARAETTGAGRLTRLLHRDPEFNIEFLRLANTATFAAGRPILSPHDVPARLGELVCQELVFLTIASVSIQRMGMPEDWLRLSVWRHCLATALLSRELAARLMPENSFEAFAAGLLHDVGRIFLFQMVPDLLLEAGLTGVNETPLDLNRERQLCGLTHMDLGAWVCIANRLPVDIVSAVRFHHTPVQAGPDAPLAALIAVADELATQWEQTGSIVPGELSASVGQRALRDLLGTMSLNALHGPTVEPLRQAVEELAHPLL